MDKKIGKLIGLCSIVWSICMVGGNISLSLLDMNREQLTQVEQGVPFVVQVTLENVEADAPMYIPGFENFRVSRAGAMQEVTTTNGKKSEKMIHEFILRTDKKGTYTIGPWAADTQKKGNVSNQLTVVVGSEIKREKSRVAKPYIFQLIVDKKKAYVGEKIVLQMQFLYTKPVEGLQPFQSCLQNFEIQEVTPPFTKEKKVKIDDVEYGMKELVVYLYPKEPGRFILHDIRIQFSAPSSNHMHNSPFGGLLDFWGVGSMKKTLRAHPVALEIQELPVDQAYKNVHAVGNFNAAYLEAQTKKATAGEGIVVTFDVYGDGNWSKMQAPQLQVPEGLSYYESNAKQIIKDGKQGKRFEFIVQGHKDGMYTIQPQTYPFFDVEKKKYEQVQTNGLQIEITPGNFYQSTVQQTDKESSGHVVEKEELVDQSEQFGSLQAYPLHVRKIRMIPHSLFVKLLWFLFLCMFVLMFYRHILRSYLGTSMYWKKQKAFLHAKQVLMRAQKKQDVAAIHTIFIQLFETLSIAETSFIRDYMIVEYVKKIGFSQDQIAAWQNFYNALLHISFAHDQHIDHTHLFQEALAWLKRMKEKV